MANQHDFRTLSTNKAAEVSVPGPVQIAGFLIDLNTKSLRSTLTATK